MGTSIQQVAQYTSLPMVTMIVGGVVAALRPPGARLTSGIQHFAAGVVFAVVAAELLPDIKKQHAPGETAASFALGVLVMLALRALSKRLEARRSHTGGLPWGLITAVGLDVLIDGLILGLGFAVGGGVGVLLAIALAVELLSLGLATTVSVAKRSDGRTATILVVIGLAVIFASGSFAGATFLRGVSAERLSMLLSFGCAALLYLVTEELLVEAHEVPETPLAAAMFFVGFLAIFVLDIIQLPG